MRSPSRGVRVTESGLLLFVVGVGRELEGQKAELEQQIK